MNDVILSIPLDSILDYLTGRRAATIPDNAQIVSTWIDREYSDSDLTKLEHTLCLRIKHPSFETLEGKRKIPKLAIADCPLIAAAPKKTAARELQPARRRVKRAAA
jgi:hypothetical protein